MATARLSQLRTGRPARIALAVLVAVVCYLAVAHSLAQSVKRNDLIRARTLAPWDARLTAALAEQRLAELQQPADEARTNQLARQALRLDATAVAAVATLGWQAQAHGRVDQARRWFDYAEALSRRDLQTQLWKIEDAVGRGDVPAALRHYDIALRTNNQASDVLFPILAAAVTQPDVRHGLSATLLRRPPWGAYFINYLTFKGPDPRANMDLLVRLQGAGWPVPERARSSLVNALVKANAVEEAWGYYAQVRPGANRRMSRDPVFRSRIDPPSVLDWVVADGDASGSIQHGEAGSFFDFAVSPSVGGPLLQQMQLLPPGGYRLEGRSSRIEQPGRSLPYWLLACRDGRELGRVVVPAARDQGVFRGQFVVPSDCPAQTLVLIARPSDDISGVVGQIDQVQLSPAGGAQR